MSVNGVTSGAANAYDVYAAGQTAAKALLEGFAHLFDLARIAACQCSSEVDDPVGRLLYAPVTARCLCCRPDCCESIRGDQFQR